ncbi:hypothetical protein [Peribacillus frigoritolerans]|uniref:hypothetical protein n=1 Tax=Peribacillus frigoritolerans TaxID=450367 RepID=UPI00344AEFA9
MIGLPFNFIVLMSAPFIYPCVGASVITWVHEKYSEAILKKLANSNDYVLLLESVFIWRLLWYLNRNDFDLLEAKKLGKGVVRVGDEENSGYGIEWIPWCRKDDAFESYS